MSPDQIVLLALAGLVVTMAIVVPVVARSGRKKSRRSPRGRRAAVAENKEEAEEAQPLRPTGRGWLGRGGGHSTYVQAPAEWRGTTVQVCGMWPYAIGAGTPMIGVPLGRHIHTGATVCGDPISWFQRANLISNPSLFVLGKPGLGKSTLVARMAAGLAGYGVMPLVLGDLRPDYVELIEALGGQVIRLGRGRGSLNVLDPGEATTAARRLKAAGFQAEAQEVLEDAHGRRLAMVSSLLTILRKQQPSDVEESIVDQALRILDRDFVGVPVLVDLLTVVQSGPDELRQVAVDRGDFDEYQRITRGLEASLISLTRGGRLGEMFSRPTTNPMQMNSPVVYDVSAIGDSEDDLRAATLLACWSNGFATVNVANVLADAGLEPRRHYFVIMDELWRALRAGNGIVDRVDFLTRLNRKVGVGTAMISHTMADLNALAEEDRMKAKGFVERSGMVICAGLPFNEMPELTKVVPFSEAEQEMLAGWQDPPAWDSARGREVDPPGRGKFLIKVGTKPGIPVDVRLTEAEKSIRDTNQRWNEQSRVGQLALEVVQELVDDRNERAS